MEFKEFKKRKWYKVDFIGELTFFQVLEKNEQSMKSKVFQYQFSKNHINIFTQTRKSSFVNNPRDMYYHSDPYDNRDGMKKLLQFIFENEPDVTISVK
jgi:hypothetical protein